MTVGSLGGSGRQRRARERVAARKRTLDVVVGGVLSIIALPVIVVLALGVALSLRSWPFFVQRRPGWQGRSLTIVKLRTLPTATPAYMDKHSLGLATLPLPWLCSMLRRTHLDELPQLFSVVLGQMSLVGPRPPLPTNVEPIGEEFEAIRRSVRPGCTGLWQLSVASTDTATGAPRFDLFYVRYASTRLDIWALVRTVGWILGIAQPIEVEDVPRWLLGPGLVDGSQVEAVDYAESAEVAEPFELAVTETSILPLPETEAMYPGQPVAPTRRVGPYDRVLAEVVD